MDPREVFKKYLLYSVGFHTLVLILLILFGHPLPPPPEPTTTVTMIRLTRSAGSRASPLLKKSGEPAPAAAAPPAAKPPEPPPAAPVKAPAPIPAQPKPPEKVVKIPTQEKKPETPRPQVPAQVPPQPAAPTPKQGPDEQKMAEALAGVKSELEQREAQTAAAPAPATGPGGGPGSPFGSPSGAISAADPELARYQSQVRSKIIREWVRTTTGMEGETLRARVVVRINASGNVISSSFARRSGNSSFDLSAQRAVERASPLPPPPALVMAEAVQEGFVVDFSSRMLR